MISGGRLVSGFVRGTGVESLATNTNPLYNRERFEEAHDLVLKTWTTPGPFRWEGKHYQFRVVNPFQVPLQKPHPPIWIPGTGSPETLVWCAERNYPYIFLETDPQGTQDMKSIYTETAREHGYEPGPENFRLSGAHPRAGHRRKGLRSGQGLHGRKHWCGSRPAAPRLRVAGGLRQPQRRPALPAPAGADSQRPVPCGTVWIRPTTTRFWARSGGLSAVPTPSSSSCAKC